MPANTSATEAATGSPPTGATGAGLPLAVGTAAVQAWLDMGTEAIRFVCDRLQQDIRTQRAMLGCTGLQELRQIQSEFISETGRQYAAETGRMLDLMGKAAASGLTASARPRRYDDLPL